MYSWFMRCFVYLVPCINCVDYHVGQDFPTKSVRCVSICSILFFKWSIYSQDHLKNTVIVGFLKNVTSLGQWDACLLLLLECTKLTRNIGTTS